MKLIDDESFNTDTNFVIAIEEEPSEYILYDIYNPCKHRGGSLNVTLYGSWSKELGLNVILTTSKYHRRTNLHLMNLSVAFVVSSLNNLFICFIHYNIHTSVCMSFKKRE